MSFDEVPFPLRVAFGSQGGPAFSTEIITVEGGYERRNQNWSQARRRFDAATGLRSTSDIASLLNFFHARAGRARGFRLRDWSDYTSAVDGTSNPTFADQIFASGDGETFQFQLQKNYASGDVTHARDIRKPVEDSVLIGVDDVELTEGWTVDTTTGIITFADPPADGLIITAGFTFDVPVRFDTDQLSLSAEDFKQYRVSIPLVEIRV
jgi:uncharacterized protein (TIGR02217 family)